MSIYRPVNKAPTSDVHAVDEAVRPVGNNSATEPRVSPAIEIDYSSRRKAKPATVMLRTTSQWLASLPSHVQPRELARQFPRIANSLCVMWKDTEAYNSYVDDLLTNRRQGRRGFAVAIVSELELLRAYRETTFPDTVDKWEHCRN